MTSPPPFFSQWFCSNSHFRLRSSRHVLCSGQLTLSAYTEYYIALSPCKWHPNLPGALCFTATLRKTSIAKGFHQLNITLRECKPFLEIFWSLMVSITIWRLKYNHTFSSMVLISRLLESQLLFKDKDVKGFDSHVLHNHLASLGTGSFLAALCSASSKCIPSRNSSEQDKLYCTELCITHAMLVLLPRFVPLNLYSAATDD